MNSKTDRKILLEDSSSSEGLGRLRLAFDILTHDLKNYLGYSNFALGELLESGNNFAGFDALVGDVAEVNAQIINMIEVCSDIYNGRELDRELCSLDTLCAKVGGIVGKGKCKLDVNIEDDCLYAADVAMSNVLSNLVINSIEANQGDLVSIKVTLKKEGDWSELHYIDDGVGISPEMIGSIFSLGASTKGEGRGTGMNICAQLCELMGGNIRAVKCDDGAYFVISLPLPC